MGYVGQVEVDNGMVRPCEFGGVAEGDVVTGGEGGVERVFCDVCGVMDKFGEADVAEAVDEVGGVWVGHIIEVEVEVTQENVVFGVYDEVGMKLVMRLHKVV